MDGIEGILADYGVRQQGKAAPMAASRAAGSASWGPNPRSTPAAPSYDGLFGAPAAANSAHSLDSLFDSFKGSSSAAAKAKLAYDDDIFDAVPGLRTANSTSSSSSARDDGDDVFGPGRAAAPAYDDVFASNRSAPPPSYDDFLGGFGGRQQVERKRSVVVEDDDLLGVFGRKPDAKEEKKTVVVEEDQGGTRFGGLFPAFSPPRSRKTNDDNIKKPAVPTSKPTASMADDPFVVLGTTSSSGSTYPSPGRFTDPLEDLDKSANSKGKNIDSTADNYSLFEDSTAFDHVPKSDPLFTSEINADSNNMHPPSKARDSSPPQSSVNRNPAHRSKEDLGNTMPKSHSSTYSDVYADGSVPSSERYSSNGVEDQSPRSSESEDDIWLTVSEIPLFTQPTSAPPPSRSPPLLKQKPVRAKANRKDDESVRRSSQNRSSYKDLPDQAEVSSLDDLEGFVKDKPQMPSHDNNLFGDDEESERNSSDREEKDRQDRLEQEREMRLREEMKREQRRLEKEREQQQQRERERQAMERATKEARERAGAEARAKAERESCQRVQRAAVQRAQQEARERAAAWAKEKAARAAAEARERADSEAKEKERAAAERAAAERVQQEARKRAERAAVEKAAAEARERQAAAAARKKPSTADDLESFFGVDARTNSAPKQRTPTVDSMFDSQPQSRASVNGSQRTASSSASMRKAPSATNIGFGDDLSDLFGAPASSGVFQEVEGESEERRRARLERHQRTNDRAAKALAEKNERDMQVQREQAERDRIADTLDFEIRRWSAGKEGNLRALLSTLQYILWPECGWQAVSLTDLITGAAVKKQYRKATLCIHPDKVQQKGATLKQKYTAEKVFDILKEAWNKFNSEELF